MDKNDYIKSINEIFKLTDRYEAHRKVAPILQSIARDKDFLFEVIKTNLLKPEFLKKKRHYPTLALEIAETPNYSFVANLWLPLPDKDTDMSLQSIHHHGNLILSTISAFGPGYDSIIFKPDYEIDFSTGVTKMKVEKQYHNDLYRLEFVEANTPHVVFYPNDFSVTLALWCNNKPTQAQIIKKVGVFKKIKKPLGKIIRTLKLDGLLGLNTVTYFDFYPEKNKLVAMKDRIGYPEGSNENFLQNIFHCLQKLNFDDEKFLQKLKSNVEINKDAHKWIDKFLSKEEIPSLFEDIHIHMPKVHIPKRDILSVTK